MCKSLRLVTVSKNPTIKTHVEHSKLKTTFKKKLENFKDYYILHLMPEICLKIGMI